VLFAFVVVESFFGALLDLPDAINVLSPFWWIGNYPSTPLDPGHMIGLGATALTLLALAVAGFRRRDLSAG
jgi:ABC-2 type transport system permease protein